MEAAVAPVAPVPIPALPSAVEHAAATNIQRIFRGYNTRNNLYQGRLIPSVRGPFSFFPRHTDTLINYAAGWGHQPRWLSREQRARFRANERIVNERKRTGYYRPVNQLAGKKRAFDEVEYNPASFIRHAEFNRNRSRNAAAKKIQSAYRNKVQAAKILRTVPVVRDRLLARALLNRHLGRYDQWHKNSVYQRNTELLNALKLKNQQRLASWLQRRYRGNRDREYVDRLRKSLPRFDNALRKQRAREWAFEERRPAEYKKYKASIAARDAKLAAEFAARNAATPIPDAVMEDVVMEDVVDPTSPIAPTQLFSPNIVDDLIAASGMSGLDEFLYQFVNQSKEKRKNAYLTIHNESKKHFGTPAYGQLRQLLKDIRAAQQQVMNDRRVRRELAVTGVGQRIGSYAKSPVRKYLSYLYTPASSKKPVSRIHGPASYYKTRYTRSRKVRFSGGQYRYSREKYRKRKRVRQ
jgi:hypothetical protein